MKNFLFLITFLFIYTSLYSQEELVWSDEFNIDGAIDSSKWFHQTQLPSGGNWYNNEEQHYTDRLENSYVSNGILNIVAKKEEHTEQGHTKQYTSARLNSKEVFKYGRMVIRAKLPSGIGTWPAIWMLGKNINEDGGYWDTSYGTTAWPACGEIDIMEHWGKNQNFVQSAMHTPSSYGGTINHGGQNIPTASSDFHEYELDWNAERMIFSVDGLVHYIYNPSTKNACEWPYDAEQYFLLNIAIEQGGADITETAMEIDYIRVYQNAEGYASSNTSLIDLKLNGETINDFNCTSPSSYTVLLPSDASIPLTTGTPTDTSATVSITAASSIPGNTIIEVIAADGITTENYTIFFVTNTNSNPTIAAPSPTKASSDVISVFSDVYTSISTDTDPDWGQNTNATEIDINGNTTLKYENLDYQGLNYEEHTDVSSMDYMHLDYYTNDATEFEFSLISHGPQENSYNIATNEGIILGQWVSIDIPLSSYTVPDLSNLFQFKTVGNGTLYLDNLYFWKESDTDTSLSDLTVDGSTIPGFTSIKTSYSLVLPSSSSTPVVTATPNSNGANAIITAASSIPGNTIIEVTAGDGITTENYTISFATNTNPPIAAPSPTKASSDVISVFSDVYTSISTDTDPNWEQTTDATEVNLNGNTTLKYENLDYQGLNYEEHTDVSSMDYIHLDYYTNDATEFEFSLISHGPQENSYNIATNEGIILGQWVSIDIPLDSYTVPDLSNLFQFKTEGNGTLYLDNLYFWKESDTDTSLSDLTVDGSTIPDFTSIKTSYSLVLPSSSSTPIVTATPTSNGAIAIITAASSIPGNTIIEVTAGDGITTENYTISFATNTNPTIAAPSPTKASSNVISVFSDVYTSISTDTDPNWNNQATDATEIDINGNNTLKYAGLTYQGLLYSNTDVSSMNYIHLDYYTNDATAFEFFLISPGPDENSYNIATSEGIILGQWVSIDIPLNSYTVPDLSNLFQFKTVGNGTIYLDNLYFWKESSNTWTGNTNNNWDTATNWSRNTTPTEATDVIIPASLSNYPTANSSVTVNSVTMASGSSLIAEEAFSGSITYTRNLETNNWYLISSPILGETYDNEFVSVNGLASSGLNNAIAQYQTSDDSWNYMQNGENHSFNSGTGYSVRRTSGSGEISFSGTLNVNNTSISLATPGNGYNLVGNPYPSYINSNSMLSSNTESLLTETLWIWNQTVYEPKNLASNFILSPGQGFFVQSDGVTGNLSITENNQIHQSNDTFQKGVSRTEINLTISDGSSKRDTNIYYIEGTTTSFDNGYDSPIFNNGGNDFGIYTHLVSNSEGNDYGIQSLPHNDFEKIVVPIGINAVSGSVITITGEKKNFPEGINMYIEDKKEQTFTILDNSSNFTTTLSSDLNGIGRFYIHTASKVLNTNYFALKNNISIYTCSKDKLCIDGIKEGIAKIQIYDILGKQILMISFEGNSVNNIALPSNRYEGIYIVQLTTQKGSLVKKIIMK